MNAVHGTAVARGGRGVLILGAAGAGKSSLALDLIALGADLVADDAVMPEIVAEGVSLVRPENIAGMIEARGVGLLSVKSIERAGLAFVVDMDKTVNERLPAPESVSILGVEVPQIRGTNVPSLGAVIWCLLGDGQVLPVS